MTFEEELQNDTIFCSIGIELYKLNILEENNWYILSEQDLNLDFYIKGWIDIYLSNIIDK